MVAWDPCQQRGELGDPMIKPKPEKSSERRRVRDREMNREGGKGMGKK